MSRTFDAVDDVLTFAVGAASTIDGGPMTWACIWRPHTSHRGGLISARNAGSRQWGVNPFDNAGGNVFFATSAGSTSLSYSAYLNEFALLAFTKANASAQARGHLYRYDTTIWAHTALDTFGDGSTIDEILVGSFDPGQFLDAELVVQGLWASVLSDVTLEGMTANLGQWLAAGPATLWAFNQTVTTDPVLDLSSTGTADQTAIVGTAVSAAEPVGWSYNIAVTIHLTAVANLGALTATATAGRTVHLTAAGGMGALAGTALVGRTVHMTGAASLGALAASASASGAVVAAGSGWYGLLALHEEIRDIYAQQRDLVPSACPNDGEPLRAGPGGVLTCTFDGWQYPRDYARPF